MSDAEQWRTAIGYEGHLLFRDIETRSTLSLPDVGAAVYAEHPTTSVWCVGYAVDDGAIELWHPGEPVPECFIEAARNPDWIIVAHNDGFERSIEEKILAPRFGFPLVPIERHRCTMAMSLACSLPAKLEKVASAIGLAFQKDAEGARLMRTMAKPRKPRKGEDPNAGPYWHDDDPEKIARLGRYCQRDVEVERALYHKLPALSDAEQELWQLDAAINGRGFHTDGALLDAAAKIADDAKESMQAELARVTDGALTSTNQVAKLQAWLAGHGCDLADMKKPTLAAARRRKNLDPAARRVIDLRRGAAADPKVHTMIAHRSADGRIRGTLRFHGAGTGRWSALGVQVQNYMRDHGGIDTVIDSILAGNMSPFPWPLAAIAYAARGAVVAAPGHRLMIGDFSGVESRVLAWVAGETTKLEQWAKYDRTGDPADDPYVILAKALGLGADGRQTGKTADLAFGFQGGIGAYAKMAPEGDASSDDDRKGFQKTWQARHPQTKRFWYAVRDAAVAAVRTPGGSFRVGNKGVHFEDSNSKSLKLRLPSGRVVRYPFPSIMQDRFNQNAVSFMDTAFGKWAPCNFGRGAYGGMFVENIVQAIARDLLAAAMLRLEAAGYRIILTIHDEIIAEVRDGFGSLEEFKRLLVEAVAWAAGLPIAAKCREALRYSKPGGTVPAELCAADPPPDDPDDAPEGADALEDMPGDPGASEPEGCTDTPGAAEPPPEAADNGERVLLIDGSNYAHRAYHAAAASKNSADAVQIFSGLIQKLLRKLKRYPPLTHIAVVFDVPGPTFRHEIYPEYKANRPDSDAMMRLMPAMRDAVRALGLVCVEQAGFEADDLIATYAREARARGAAVTIVTGDKDMMQLVSDRVEIRDPAFDRIGIAEVIAKFGVPPGQVIDVQALMGDKTDNVPGVPGIGEVKAALLVSKFGDLETVLANGPPKVRQHADQARLSRRLVRLDSAVAGLPSLDSLAVAASPATPGRVSEPGVRNPGPGVCEAATAPLRDTASPPPWGDDDPPARESEPEPARPNGKGDGHDQSHDFRSDSGADDHRASDPNKLYRPVRAALAARGYRLAKSFPFTVPGDTEPLFFDDRYELAPSIAPSPDRPRKTHRFRHQGDDGQARSGTGSRRIIYNWPAILAAGPGAPVFITEGANKAEPLNAAGLLATAAPYHKWEPEMLGALAGRHVIYLEDHDHPDEKGKVRAKQYSADAQARLAPGAASFRIVPGLHLWRDLKRDGDPFHGFDVKNWIEAGGDPKRLPELCREIPTDRPKLHVANIRAWDTMPAPEIGYGVPDRFPLEVVCLFSGEGGGGKSTTTQQLGVAHALGREWLGCVPRQGPAIYVECEDPEKALHWRQKAIAEHYGVTQTTIANAGFHMLPMADGESSAVLATAPDKSGIIHPTPLYEQLYEMAGDIKPVMIGIASAAIVFAGNENARPEVQQFLWLLRRLARVSGGYVLLVAQPSLTGIGDASASHAGLSGTTQWHNGCRGRAVLRNVKPEGNGADTGLREIKFYKNQYGPLSSSCFVRWQNGLFLPVAGMSTDQAERATKAEGVFVALLKLFTSQKQVVSHAVGRNYAPARFAEHPGAEGITRKDFSQAMQRLLDAKAIEIRTWGRPSHPSYYLAQTGAD
jgi:DNA polymerase